jgi:hypothetical protein
MVRGRTLLVRGATVAIAAAVVVAVLSTADASPSRGAEIRPTTAAGGGPVRVQVSPPDHVLVDLAPGAFYVTPVRWLHGAGHTSGVQPGWFGPDLTITRAELFTMMWRVAGEPGAPPSSFPDVPRGAYFAPAVDWAYATGVTTGVGGTGQFRPHDALTRGQAATFLWRDEGEPPPVTPTLPGYTSSVSTVTAADLPHSWRAGCPVHWSDLRRLTLRYIGFDGRSKVGQLVLHHQAVWSANEVFADLYAKRFPIEEVTVVDVVGGSDDAAMAWNLTTAFNCRAVTGGSGWSEHAYGRAIDVNPLQNPYISRSGQVLPPGGAAYLDRSTFRVGMITPSSPPVGAFEIMGWTWGGRWTSPKDYQHFELP